MRPSENTRMHVIIQMRRFSATIVNGGRIELGDLTFQARRAIHIQWPNN